MIIKALIGLVNLLLDLVFALIPDIPNLDNSIIESINYVINIIFENSMLLGLFVNVSTIKILVPLTIFVINIEKIFTFFKFILKKIPFLNIS